MEQKYDKWIEINLEDITHNLQEIRGLMDKESRLIAVVKANAYGLGAAEIARHLAEQGVDFFGVTFLSEALELREHGIRADILIFSPLHPEEYGTAVDHDLIVTVASREDWLAVQQEARDRRIRIHLKLDTGMGRFGLMGYDAENVAQEAFVHNNVALEGIYTHFASPGDYKHTHHQFSIFENLLQRLDEKGIKVACRHCCASSAFLRYPSMRLDAVRIGTLLWGQYPAGTISPVLKLRDVYHFKARIIAIRQMAKGSSLGYYHTHKLRKNAVIAIVPAGLADGWGLEALPKPSGWLDMIKMVIKPIAMFFNLNLAGPRIIIGNGEVFVRGKIFMQFCLVEVPPGMEVKTGDSVEIPVKRTLASLSIKRIYRQESSFASEKTANGITRNGIMY
ncbi:MAG: alanine racemase [Syntrophomonadaceae bacterium]|nr:alanine racemase [Syntrophomonadaceae bacterium]